MAHMNRRAFLKAAAAAPVLAQVPMAPAIPFSMAEASRIPFTLVMRVTVVSTPGDATPWWLNRDPIIPRRP